MHVELRPISTIRPYENNPRLNDAGVDAVAASIRDFGFRQPIVVDEDGVIIVGHARYKAALKLGLETVPVHVAADLTPEQIKAYRIADNQTADAVGLELRPVAHRAGPAARHELRPRPARLRPGRADAVAGPGRERRALTDPDDVPEPPDEAITQPGDLWLLGKHRLMCGDSSKPEDVDRLLDGAAIHLVNWIRPTTFASSHAAITPSPRGCPPSRAPRTTSNSTSRVTPRRPSPPPRSCAPRTDPWPTTSSPRRSSTACCRRGSATWPACCCLGGPSIFGEAMRTWRITRPS